MKSSSEDKLNQTQNFSFNVHLANFGGEQHVKNSALKN